MEEETFYPIPRLNCKTPTGLGDVSSYPQGP